MDRGDTFWQTGKAEPTLIGPFKSLPKFGTVAYRLELPKQLSKYHSTFHVLSLKKCLSDKTLVIPLDEIQIDDNPHFVKEPVEIMDCEIKVNLTAPTLTIPGIEKLNPYSIVDVPFVGIVYENNKKDRRIMSLTEIPKFYDATLDKVLKEVSLKIVESRYKLKNPLLGELDLNIMEAFEREIEKHLKHRRQMRRWESFVNGRPLLQWPLHQTTRVTTLFKSEVFLHTPCLGHASVHGATHERNRTTNDMTHVILISDLGCPPRGLPLALGSHFQEMVDTRNSAKGVDGKNGDRPLKSILKKSTNRHAVNVNEEAAVGLNKGLTLQVQRRVTMAPVVMVHNFEVDYGASTESKRVVEVEALVQQLWDSINPDKVGTDDEHNENTSKQVGSQPVNDGSTSETPSFANILCPKPVTSIIHFCMLVNDEKLDSFDCVLPQGAVNMVKGRYDNLLVRFFVRNGLAFMMVQNYVNNVWSKFGLEKLMKNYDGVYLFKFSSKSGMEQGRISFARALIKFSLDSELKKEVIMAILDKEGAGYIKEVIRVVPTTPFVVATVPSSMEYHEEDFVEDMNDASNLGANDSKEGASSQPSIAKASPMEDINYVLTKSSFEALIDSNDSLKLMMLASKHRLSGLNNLSLMMKWMKCYISKEISLDINLISDLKVDYIALGWRLEDIHMTWAHLEKKQTRLRTCTKIHQEVLFSERGDGVTSIKRRRCDLSGDGVWILATTSQRRTSSLRDLIVRLKQGDDEPIKSAWDTKMASEEGWNRIKEYVQYQDDLWDSLSLPMNVSSISEAMQPTFRGCLKRACNQISYLETPAQKNDLSYVTVCLSDGDIYDDPFLLRFYLIDDTPPWGNSNHKEKGEDGLEWTIRSRFEDELANFMLEKKSHTKGIGEMLDQQGKELHEQFSPILSTIRKSETPKPEAPTFAITTRSGVSTQDTTFPAPSQSTSANHTEGTTKKEGHEDAKPSIIQEPAPRPSIFYQPSKSSNLPFLSRLKKQKKDDEDERILLIFNQIHINLPFLEAMIHMPKGAKESAPKRRGPRKLYTAMSYRAPGSQERLS
ncbi:hypothetical protein Tco_0099271 [Tanacetum coccineum]